MSFPFSRIIQGDCVQVLNTPPAESVDLVLTDLPYSVRNRDRHARRIANDDDLGPVLDASGAVPCPEAP